MKYYTVNQLREMYLSFFEQKQHTVVGSYSLVPQNDNSLLLINSGMAPLKPYFTGQEEPPNVRMATCQKCIRTGDIDNVGKTDRHGTFFEMLGNFSFGDYFKKEAIQWAWEFFTQVLEIPKQRLYVSVYLEDDEAASIWNQQEGVPIERIIRMGKADNFWEHGLGPCGPCSEIYYDRGEQYGCDKPDCAVGCDCDRYIEVWNLVFTQFEKLESGEYQPLKNPNIDTGMGLERLALVMQDAASFFDIDTMLQIRDRVCQIADIKYHQDPEKDVSIRVIMDHIRSVTFMTSDGIMPSNEGRGYVLRRLLRRAVRHGRILGIDRPFLTDIAQVVIDSSCAGYPELKEKEAYILKVLAVEEERFIETIDQGMEILNAYLQELGESKQLEGEKAFKLYDTYGFPIDLTIEIANEKGIQVDQAQFHQEMAKQKQRARDAREESTYMGAGETVYHKLPIHIGGDFDGYQQLALNSRITAMTNEQQQIKQAQVGDKISIFVETTPFYATSGGQVADIGQISTETGQCQIKEVIKVVGDNIAHIGEVVSGTIQVGQQANLKVAEVNRQNTARNHSATHLLQKALKTVLGDHVEQAGSSVSGERLRFDFTHFEAISKQDLKKIDALVNQSIRAGYEVSIQEMDIETAKAKGAMALFGEKYGDVVRVVDMAGYSIELCGGTHVTNTADIGLFKIVSEGGIAAGVRRIEAITGAAALNYYQELEQLVQDSAGLLKTEVHNIYHKTETLLQQIKQLKQENAEWKAKQAGEVVEQFITDKILINQTNVVIGKVQAYDKDMLRELGDKLKDKLTNSVIVLFSEYEGKVLIIVMVDAKAEQAGGHAGRLIGQIAKVVGGGGGGKPQMAQAGGKDTTKIEQAMELSQQFIRGQING